MELLGAFKKRILPFLILFVFTSSAAFAINPYYVHKSQSLGDIFRDAFSLFSMAFTHFSIYTLLFMTPAIIIGYFVHRKYLAYSFFVIFPIIFISTILFDKDSRLSNLLLMNIFNYYLVVLNVVVAFLASTLFNKIRKKKKNFSNKDFIPFGIMVGITLLLMFLPIRTGHIVCKTPVINQYFSCDYYLREAKQMDRSWFVY